MVKNYGAHLCVWPSKAIYDRMSKGKPSFGTVCLYGEIHADSIYIYICIKNQEGSAPTYDSGNPWETRYEMFNVYCNVFVLYEF